MADETPGPEAVAFGALGAQELLAALEELPPELREALVLRAFEGLSYSQIGEALLISEGLARWRVHRARGKLAAALARAKEEAGGPRE